MYTKFKAKLYQIVFEADTPAGKAFDIILLIAILFSIILVMLESIQSVEQKHGHTLRIAEWTITLIFSIEYALRLYIVKKRWKYVFSFFGLVDFFSILPSFLSLFIPGTRGLAVIRSLRLLRVFRILKLSRYVSESQELIKAIKASKHKIGVFLFFIIMLVIILGTIMYFIEGKESGFTSIPQSIYWAIVTLTTVGYGDITPVTALGKSLSSIVMILGYAILAVPTGIITSELNRVHSKLSTQVCENCMKEGHDADAVFCKYCGSPINQYPENHRPTKS